MPIPSTMSITGIRYAFLTPNYSCNFSPILAPFFDNKGGSLIRKDVFNNCNTRGEAVKTRFSSVYEREVLEAWMPRIWTKVLEFEEGENRNRQGRTERRQPWDVSGLRDVQVGWLNNNPSIRLMIQENRGFYQITFILNTYYKFWIKKYNRLFKPEDCRGGTHIWR